MNIPNTLTIIRIVLIPAFVTAVMYDRFFLALCLFVIAALTDLIDGLIARMTNQRTALGTFLDPIADKFLLVTSFILFTTQGWLPKWLAITVISRDLIIVTGWLLLYFVAHTSKVEPLLTGKLAIASQITTLAYVLLQINIPSLPSVPDMLLFFTAGTTAFSGIQYIYRGFTLTNAS